MAIQFNCPYCTAPIRVADSFAGLQGKCPRCQTKLIVPNVAPPGATGQAVPNAGNSSGAPPRSGQAAADPNVTPKPNGLSDQPTQVTGAASYTQVMPTLLADATVPTGIPMLVTDDSRTSALAGRRRNARGNNRRSSTYRVRLIGMFAVCLLVLLAALATFMMTRLPRLSGQLTAQVMQDSELPVTLIPWAQLNLSPADRETLEKRLIEKPETFRSDQMVCSFVGSSDGVRVELSSGDATQWVVVDLASRAPVTPWLQNNMGRIETVRRDELSADLSEWVALHLKLAEGGAGLMDAVRFRDGVGLTSASGALGFAVEAVTPSRVIRCAAQDHSGKLYFAIPREATSFQLRGRRGTDGQPMFPGEFEVLIDRTQVIPSSTPIETPPTGETEENSSEPAAPEEPHDEMTDEAEKDDDMPDKDKPNPTL